MWFRDAKKNRYVKKNVLAITSDHFMISDQNLWQYRYMNSWELELKIFNNKNNEK